MLQSYFTAFSGMLTFSRGLDNISNNIANMNTPGFKGTDLFYRAARGGNIGSNITGQSLRLGDGDVRQTSNNTDLALNGNGWFIVRDANKLFYTRAGQFVFNDKDVLVDRNTGFEVVAYDSNGKLGPVNLTAFSSLSAQSTTQVNFAGNVKADQNSPPKFNVTVFNSMGEKITLQVKFTRDQTEGKTNAWKVSIQDDKNNDLTAVPLDLEFDANGQVKAEFAKQPFTIPAPNNGSAAVPLELTLNFADQAGIDGLRLSATSSFTVKGNSADGRSLSGIKDISFTDLGEVKITYTNSETASPFQLALAIAKDSSALTLVDGNLFRIAAASEVLVGKPGSGGFATVVSGALEASNVDLTSEFSELILVQRGYQASSKVMNVADELIKQLYERS